MQCNFMPKKLDVCLPLDNEFAFKGVVLIFLILCSKPSLLIVC